MASNALQVGSARFRVRPWQGRADIAYLAPVTTAATLGPAVLASVRESLQNQGYRSVVTSALPPSVRDCLVADGFEARCELEAMTCDLSSPLPRLPDPRWRTRKLRRTDLAQVVIVDADAFAPFWRLDAAGIQEARSVTPFSRWRAPVPSETPTAPGSPQPAQADPFGDVEHTSCTLKPAGPPRTPKSAKRVRGQRDSPASSDEDAPALSAYCISGRSGRRGYLQRLAVSARWQGHGLGILLVADSLRWLKRGGARAVAVNTHPENERALSLYERCGFKSDHDPLTVLCRDLT